MSNQPFCPQTALLKGPETGTYLEVPAGSQFSVRLRAKPNGSIYSGHWSDWSDVLTGDNPTDISKLTLQQTSTSSLFTFGCVIIIVVVYKMLCFALIHQNMNTVELGNAFFCYYNYIK